VLLILYGIFFFFSLPNSAIFDVRFEPPFERANFIPQQVKNGNTESLLFIS